MPHLGTTENLRTWPSQAVENMADATAPGAVKTPDTVVEVPGEPCSVQQLRGTHRSTADSLTVYVRLKALRPRGGYAT